MIHANIWTRLFESRLTLIELTPGTGYVGVSLLVHLNHIETVSCPRSLNPGSK